MTSSVLVISPRKIASLQFLDIFLTDIALLRPGIILPDNSGRRKGQGNHICQKTRFLAKFKLR
jgi:hypothetical protein